MASAGRGVPWIAQRLSLGEEVVMAAVKKVKKAAVKVPVRVKKVAAKVGARSSIKFVYG